MMVLYLRDLDYIENLYLFVNR